MTDPFLEEAFARDAADPLRHYREAFMRDPSIIYLDGNSLGLLPKRSKELLLRALEHQWGLRAVRAWNEHWIDLPSRLGGKIASLIGAQPHEVLVCDSTSVNFYKLVGAALAISKRSRVVTDEATFPSNAYVLQGCADPKHIQLVASPDGVEVPPESIESALNSRTALLTLNHATFKSGWVHDMERLSLAAREAGAMSLWDLSHSVGVLPIDLNRCGADLAVGCTYKYLNGGPGAPAFLFVREALQNQLRNPIQGWFGQRDAFAFGLEYEPKEGIARFMSGTPPILSMAAVEGGVDLVIHAGIGPIRRKSEELTSYLIRVWEECLKPLEVSLNSPAEPSQRGSHVSFGHPRGYGIARALIEEMHVVPDFRHPDNIRFGFAPLYNSFQDAWEAADRLRQVIQHRMYERYESQAGVVT